MSLSCRHTQSLGHTQRNSHIFQHHSWFSRSGVCLILSETSPCCSRWWVNSFWGSRGKSEADWLIELKGLHLWQTDALISGEKRLAAALTQLWTCSSRPGLVTDYLNYLFNSLAGTGWLIKTMTYWLDVFFSAITNGERMKRLNKCINKRSRNSLCQTAYVRRLYGSSFVPVLLMSKHCTHDFRWDFARGKSY